MRRRARTGFGVLVAAFIALGAVAPIFATSASAAPVDTIYSLVNQARAAAGLRGFLHNQSLDAVAETWANQMGADAALSHNPQYSAQIPGGWTRAGENVAEGYPTPQAMFDGWMKSPGHRANILGDYTDIGIAFVSVNGQTWGVQDFAKYPGHVGPAAPQPAPPAAVPPPAAPPVAVPTSVPTTASAPPPTPPVLPSPSLSPRPRPRLTAAPTTAGEGGSSQAGGDLMGNGIFGALLVSVVVALAGVGLTLALWKRRSRSFERK